MKDDRFFFSGATSLRRGKRRFSRTDTCRPCLMWLEDTKEFLFRGIAMNVSPHGLLVRTLDALPPGTRVKLQLMRDEDFEEAMSDVLDGLVVRNAESGDGFTDLGIQLIRPEIHREVPRPVRPPRRVPLPRRSRPRMHIVDFTVGDRGVRKTGK